MVSLVVPLETFGKEGIIEFFKISMLLLILFGHWFNIQPFGGAQISPNSFVLIAF